MPAESPSPPLSRTENTALPLCSELLSPGPQPFWREGKVAAFSLPLSLRGIALRRLRLQCFSSREDTFRSSHSGHHVFAEQIFQARLKKKKSFDFLRSGVFFPIILLLHSNTRRDLFFSNLCSSFVCLLKLSLHFMQQNVRQRNMSKFWQHQEETEPQPKILL